MSPLKLLYGRQRIAARIRRLAGAIERDYTGRDLMIVGVLKGASIFVADLVRQLRVPVAFDFIRIQSYGSGTQPIERPRITAAPGNTVQGAHVLLVDDIIDTGSSALTLFQYFSNQRPASLKTCFLIDKSGRRQVAFHPDYVGFELVSGYVVGYGMDHAERYRNLPDIYLLESRVTRKT